MICIRGVFGSNLARNNNYSELFRGLLPDHPEEYLKIRPRPFTSTFSNSLAVIMESFKAVWSELLAESLNETTKYTETNKGSNYFMTQIPFWEAANEF